MRQKFSAVTDGLHMDLLGTQHWGHSIAHGHFLLKFSLSLLNHFFNFGNEGVMMIQIDEFREVWRENV